ncbi:MAG: hypothetical protein KDA69_18890 [Planctomycetaceae bacterium]|nr:hypothetical protein [Planctomycetaceae bacterium]MCA9046400.1 hypothetical protein [Planctomycetaceae bacterium]MCB9953765.1 hypothetical protein [Planctomycetaceae bacterium]
MDVFIYFKERLPVGLDVLEDALDAALGENGEVTGSGTGQVGSNLDLYVDDNDMSVDEVVEMIRRALGVYGIPKSSTIVIGENNFSVV